MPIVTKLDVVMARRKMSLTELSDRVKITLANLSNIKRGKARAIRFTTLEALCDALSCQPADIIEFQTEQLRRADLDINLMEILRNSKL